MNYKKIKGWPYEVSDVGTVRRIGSDSIRAFHVHASTGYPTVTLNNGWHTRKTFRVHTLVAIAFIGPRPAGKQVNHKDGNKGNNRLENLEYVTPKENKAHAKANGLVAVGDRNWTHNHPESVRGSRNPFAKLNEAQVDELRWLYHSTGRTQYELSRKYGITQANVSDIVRGKTWKHVGGQ